MGTQRAVDNLNGKKKKQKNKMAVQEERKIGGGKWVRVG